MRISCGVYSLARHEQTKTLRSSVVPRVAFTKCASSAETPRKSCLLTGSLSSLPGGFIGRDSLLAIGGYLPNKQGDLPHCFFLMFIAISKGSYSTFQKRILYHQEWGSYTVSQLKDSGSLGKINTAVDCLVDKTDVPLSSLQSSNIFLKPQVVFYDGVCHLCNSGVNWVIRADKGKRISFCAVQSEVAEPYLLLCGLTREDVLDRFLFVEGAGQYSQASTAALRVALYLPFPYPVLGALLIIPAPLRDAVYDFVARRRYKWFGRADTCILPSEDVLDHFIDRDEIITKLRQKRED